MEREGRRIPIRAAEMIFLYSSYLVAVTVENDQNHENAIKLNREIAKGKFGRAVISDYIFDETVTVIFGRTKDTHKAILLGTNLLDSAKNHQSR
ncbi:MAG: hypothetical protein HYU39_02700 [Thaumarchaeota archaeon]|nr:hypothetical protein [Nitrososphaerota archaeon]